MSLGIMATCFPLVTGMTPSFLHFLSKTSDNTPLGPYLSTTQPKTSPKTTSSTDRPLGFPDHRLRFALPATRPRDQVVPKEPQVRRDFGAQAAARNGRSGRSSGLAADEEVLLKKDSRRKTKEEGQGGLESTANMNKEFEKSANSFFSAESRALAGRPMYRAILSHLSWHLS